MLMQARKGMLVAFISFHVDRFYDPCIVADGNIVGVDAIAAATRARWVRKVVAPRSATLDCAELGWKVANEIVRRDIKVLEWQACRR